MRDRILVVEDDPAILRGLGDNLRAEAYEVLTACDGETGYRLMLDHDPDLVVLDVMLPRLSGIEVCRRARGEGLTTPIVMLTARNAEADRVNGLDAGANDYVAKPFLVQEVLARIRGLLRYRREGDRERHRLQAEMRSAASVQQQMLPQSKPQIRTLDCAGLCHPAKWIGGDAFDFIEVAPGLTALVLADVAGKGISAALTMASIHSVIRTEAPRYGSRGADLVARLNAIVANCVQPGRYVTLFYSLYDDQARALTYVNAGHTPPVIVRRGDVPGPGSALVLEASVPPVGMFPVINPQEQTFAFGSGDWLLAFSDGVTEAVDAEGDEFGRHRVVDVVMRHREQSADEVCDALYAAVREHAAGQPPFDDLTIIAGRGV